MSESSPKADGLAELRERIDELDHEVLRLLAQRLSVVAEVAALKRTEGRQIRDFERERALLDDRRKRAAELGLPRESIESIESIYRQIMLASRDYQASLGAAAPLRLQPKQVTVVGGEGKMGQLLCRMFADLGHHVTSADLATSATPERAAASADVVVIAVPIEVTEQVIRRIGPLLREDALMLDITSLKRAPVDWMLEVTRASVCGTHPMFGPGVRTLMGQRVVLCRGRGQRWGDWLAATLQARGLIVTEATPDEHDRAMALVQVLTHFQTQVLGLTLARMGQSVHETRRFTSPAYLMELYVAARHFAQEPELYGPIEMLNSQTPLVTEQFRDAAQELSEVLRRRDQARFAEIFAEVRAFFGDFAVEATERSSFLIDRLIEREMG